MALETPKIFTGNRVLTYKRLPEDAGSRADGEKIERKYAIATDAYVENDGWVLKPRGAQLAGHVLPMLYNHDGLPLGRWTDFEFSDDEIRARPEWRTKLNADAMEIRDCFDSELLMTSINFKVKTWHAPDEIERAKYCIPEKAHYAAVADTWLMKENSLTPTPADPDCGPRSTRTIIAARSVEYITREEKEASDAALKLAFKEMLDKVVANIQVSLQEVRTLIPAPTQRAENATNSVETCGSADGDVSQQDRAHGRSNDNNTASLGKQKRSWREIVNEKLRERNSTVTTNANSTSQAGDSENG